MNKEKTIKLIITFTAVVLLLAVVFIGGIVFGVNHVNNTAKSNKPINSQNLISSLIPSLNEKPQLSLAEQAEALLSQMSDKEKIGQLFVIGVDGTEIDANAKRLIRDYHVGGVVLFNRNMVSPSQTTTLVNQLQKENSKQNADLPLFICIDQEGGLVLRMSERVSPIPAQEDLAASSEPSSARFWAEKNAAELKSMGINVNFAPVVDLGATYKRSYGTDPATVENFAREALGGYQAKDMLSCLKHFPGIGKTKVDPHEDTSVIDASRQVLAENDLAPFKNLIRDLDNQTFMVMVSHLKYPAYDSEFPASLSKIIMQDLLRQELGFKGLITTDDMEMGALTKIYPFAEMGYMSVNAGADLVLVCHDFNNQIAVYDGVAEALQNGSLRKETLDERVRRIIMAKLTKIHYQELDPLLSEKIVGKTS